MSKFLVQLDPTQQPNRSSDPTKLKTALSRPHPTPCTRINLRKRYINFQQTTQQTYYTRKKTNTSVITNRFLCVSTTGDIGGLLSPCTHNSEDIVLTAFLDNEPDPTSAAKSEISVSHHDPTRRWIQLVSISDHRSSEEKHFFRSSQLH